VEIDSARRWAEAVVHARTLGPAKRLTLHVRERPREEKVLSRKMGIGRVSRKWERTDREFVRFHTRLFLAQQDPPVVAPEAALEQDLFPADEEDETFARVCLRGIVSSLAVQRVPINLIVLVDTSSSMSGTKIAAAKAAARAGAATLQNGDQLTVISFDSAPRTVVPTVVKGNCDEQEWAAGLSAIARLEAGGSTDMQAAIASAASLAELAFTASKSNRVLLITDGKPNKAEGLLEGVGGLSSKGISTTTLGIGDDFNETLLADLAQRGLGACYYVRHGEQMVEVMKQEIANLSLVVGRQCKLTLRPAAGVTINEVYGYPSGLAASGETVVEIGDILSNANRDVLARISYPPMDRGRHKLLEFQVTYLDTATNKRTSSSVLQANFAEDKAELSTAAPVGLVVERIAKAHSARAMRQAVAKLAEDDIEGALTVLNCQAAEVLLAAKRATGAAARKRLGNLATELRGAHTQAIRSGGKVNPRQLGKELAMRSHSLATS
jgi:Ca-activated chloride channel family protein